MSDRFVYGYRAQVAARQVHSNSLPHPVRRSWVIGLEQAEGGLPGLPGCLHGCLPRSYVREEAWATILEHVSHHGAFEALRPKGES